MHQSLAYPHREAKLMIDGRLSQLFPALDVDVSASESAQIRRKLPDIHWLAQG